MVHLKCVTKRYGGTTAVRDISFAIAPGEYAGLVGPSGCGKTTLLRVIAGLERPDAGEVWLDGELVSSPTLVVPPHQRAIGMVFQSLALWPHLTVEEHLAYVLQPATHRKELSAKIGSLLDLVKLTAKRRDYPGQMSGGEQQRLALIRAIAPSPAVLLLDEPMNSLDRQAKRELALEIRSLRKQLSLTVLHVTHDWRDLRGLADRVLEIDLGVLMREGPATEYFRAQVEEELVL